MYVRKSHLEPRKKYIFLPQNQPSRAMCIPLKELSREKNRISLKGLVKWALCFSQDGHINAAPYFIISSIFLIYCNSRRNHKFCTENVTWRIGCFNLQNLYDVPAIGKNFKNVSKNKPGPSNVRFLKNIFDKINCPKKIAKTALIINANW